MKGNNEYEAAEAPLSDYRAQDSRSTQSVVKFPRSAFFLQLLYMPGAWWWKAHIGLSLPSPTLEGDISLSSVLISG